MVRALLSDVPDGVIEKTQRNEPLRVEVRKVPVPERIPVPAMAEKSPMDKEKEEERTRQRKLLESAMMAATRVEGGERDGAVIARQSEGELDANLGDLVKELRGGGTGGRRIQQAAFTRPSAKGLPFRTQKSNRLSTFSMSLPQGQGGRS